MLLYSIIMFLTALLFAGIGLAIYKGKTDLIHGYHRTKVTDNAAYGKAFGKAMFFISATLLISGILGLANDSDKMVLFAVAVLILGLVMGIVCIAVVQRKYNGGIFDT